VSFWAKRGAGNVPDVTLLVSWFSGTRKLLRSQAVPLSLSKSWRQAVAEMSAPSGTATVNLELYSSDGSVGDVVFLDDFVVPDATE
jgi:hypothetical protein